MELCRACSSSRRAADQRAERVEPDSFTGWVSEQTPSALVLKVTAIAGVELALTSVWLRAMSQAGPGVASVAPFV